MTVPTSSAPSLPIGIPVITPSTMACSTRPPTGANTDTLVWMEYGSTSCIGPVTYVGNPDGGALECMVTVTCSRRSPSAVQPPAVTDTLLCR